MLDTALVDLEEAGGALTAAVESQINLLGISPPPPSHMVFNSVTSPIVVVAVFMASRGVTGPNFAAIHIFLQFFNQFSNNYLVRNPLCHGLY